MNLVDKLEVLAREFDAIAVDDAGKCNWSDVIRLQVYLREIMSRHMKDEALSRTRGWNP